MSDPFGFDPGSLGKIPLFAELQRLLAWDGGPINWDLATQVAVASASPHEGAGADAIPREAATQAFDLAARFLTDASGLETDGSDPELLGSVEWTARARGLLAHLLEPIAARSAGTDALDSLPMPDGVPADEIAKALAAAGPMLFAFQTGSVLGAAAGVVTSWGDLGVMPETPTLELLPAVLGRRIREDRIDERLGLQAAALQSLAACTIAKAATTLQARSLAAFLETVAALEVDLAGMGDRLPDLEDPEAMMQMLQGGFQFEPGPAAQAARDRVEAIGALFLASVDLLAEAGGARAGIGREVFETVRAGRASDEVTALRAAMALPPATATPARSFVTTVVSEGGYASLLIALDDPLRAPEIEELRDPLAWIARTR